MRDSLRALLIDDNPDDRALVVRALRREFPDLSAREVSDEKGLTQCLDGGPVDLVVTDFQLRWSNGLHALRAIKARWPDCPVIMFTGTGSEEIAVEAMKSGLDDYVLKSPNHFSRLPAAARMAITTARQRRQLKQAEARYGGLFDSVPIGLYRANAQGQLLDANPALVEMLHYPDRSRLLSVNLADLYVNAADFQRWKQRVEQQGIVHRFEAPLRAFDGGVCWAQNSARATSFDLPSADLRTYDGSLEDTSERKKAEDERERLILELQEALATVKALGGLLPICASCKKIRDPKGAWNQIEEFIQNHSDAEFTHSFCPECMHKLYPEVFGDGLAVER